MASERVGYREEKVWWERLAAGAGIAWGEAKATASNVPLRPVTAGAQGREGATEASGRPHSATDLSRTLSPLGRHRGWDNQSVKEEADKHCAAGVEA